MRKYGISSPFVCGHTERHLLMHKRSDSEIKRISVCVLLLWVYLWHVPTLSSPEWKGSAHTLHSSRSSWNEKKTVWPIILKPRLVELFCMKSIARWCIVMCCCKFICDHRGSKKDGAVPMSCCYRYFFNCRSLHPRPITLFRYFMSGGAQNKCAAEFKLFNGQEWMAPNFTAFYYHLEGGIFFLLYKWYLGDFIA